MKHQKQQNKMTNPVRWITQAGDLKNKHMKRVKTVITKFDAA